MRNKYYDEHGIESVPKNITLKPSQHFQERMAYVECHRKHQWVDLMSYKTSVHQI